MASTAEPFSRAIWSSRSRDRKPVRRTPPTPVATAVRTNLTKQRVESDKNKKTKTWNVFGKLHQNLNLACCHLGQQQEVLLGAVLLLELETTVHPQSHEPQPPNPPRPRPDPHQFLCHVLRNLMLVVSFCDDLHQRLLLFADFNLQTRKRTLTRCCCCCCRRLADAHADATLDGLVVEETCLLSALSPASVSSPVDCPGEALVFFRSLFDLHWISVSRPAGTETPSRLLDSDHFLPAAVHISTINS